MRVLLATDAVGGVWVYSCELRAALLDAGIEVVLATLGPQPPPEADVRYCACRLEWQEDPWASVARSGRWLVDLSEEHDVDVVQLAGYAHGALRWPVPTVIVAHSCRASWQEAVPGADAPPAQYRDAVRAGLARTDALVAPSRAMLAALSRIYALERDGVTIHNGIAPSPEPAGVREPVILAAGRMWDEAKGLAVLDRAAGELSWPVHAVGDRGGAGAQHVRLLGTLPRATLRARMARAAIFAHPARYEPFGLVVLEAAAAGCALVLGDIPSLRELWDGAAAFVAPGDSRGLARTLEQLSQDGRERGRLARAASARARVYTAERMARAYVRLYSRVAARQGVVA